MTKKVDNKDRDCGCFWKWILQYSRDNLVDIKNWLAKTPRAMYTYYKEDFKWNLGWKWYNFTQTLWSIWDFFTDPFAEIIFGFFVCYYGGVMILVDSTSEPLLLWYQWLIISILGYIIFARGQFRRTCKL